MKIVFVPSNLDLENYTVVATNVNSIEEVINAEDFKLVDLRKGKINNIYNRAWLSYEQIYGKTRKVSFIEAYDVMTIGVINVKENNMYQFEERYIGVIALVEDNWSINRVCSIAI